MASNIQKDAEINLKVNSQDSEQTIERLEKRAKELRKRFAEATRLGDTKGIDDTVKALNKVNRELDKNRTNAQKVEAAMKDLDKATPKELRRTISLINSELNSGRVVRGSKEWDAYIAKLRATQSELQRVNTQISGLGKAQGGFLSGFAGTFTKWWGTYTILTQAIDGVNMKLSTMRKNFRDKGEAQANLKALTGLDDDSISWLTKKAETLSQEMDETGLRVRQSSKEILEAYMLVGSNKPELLTDKQALNDVTVETMRLSSAAGMGLKEAVDATTTALNQYGAGADEAAKYVNVLAAGSKLGAANVEQQAAAILKAGTAASMADVPIEQLVGSIETLGEKGIKGEVAGTGLKKFYLTLQSGAEETNPKVVGLTEALENLKKKVDEAEAKRTGGGASFLKKMFGEEAFSVASIMTSNIDKFEAYTQAVTGTSVAMEQAAINSDTLAAKKAQLKNKMIETGNELVERLNPSLGILVSWQTKLIGCLPDVIDFIVENKKTIITLAVAYGTWIACQKLAIAKQIVLNKYTAISTALQATYTAAVNLCAVAYYTLTGNTLAARNAMTAFNAACASNPVGAVVTVLTAAVVAFTMFKSSADKAAKSVDVMGRVTENAALRREKEREAIKKQIEELEKFKGSKEDEEKLCNRLNEKYGTVLGNYKSAAEWLDTLKKKGDKWVETIYKQILAEGKKEAAMQLRAEAERKRAEGKAQEPGFWDTFNRLVTVDWNKVGVFRMQGWDSASKEVKARIEADAEKDAKALEDYATKLTNEAAKALAATPTITTTEEEPDGGGGGNGGGGDDDDEKKRREAERKRREELKAALDAEKAQHEKSIAEIMALYATGGTDYRQYIEAKEKADEDYIKAQMDVYRQRNMEDSSEYASLLRQQEEMKKKHLDKIRKLDIADLKKLKEQADDLATSNFYDPNSAVFQNQVALNEALLKADVDFLQGKMKLYQKGSEEYMAVEQELESRLAQERKRKRQETADAYMRFLEEYGKASGSVREQQEIATLDAIHKAGLISEEEYQKALQDIKDKYVKEDKDKANSKKNKEAEERWEDFNDGYNPSGEFDRMIANIYTSWVDLFADLDVHSEDFFERFAGAAQAAFALVSAGLSQVSGYMQACQDAEIAKIEARYDKEIEAAGKNQRKVARLEKQKEQEVAKTKKKYNDRAMKMEIAQAIAQTATNALGAYGAMVKIPVVGPALAAAAAAMATAAGMIQIATIKKQHEAQASGYYSGGFTSRSADNRKEVGVVHANEFVANHEAVANPAIAPVLQLIDRAQKSNTVGSLTSDDVSNALGRNQGVSARGGDAAASGDTSATAQALELLAGVVSSSGQTIKRLSDLIANGLPTYMVMDGEQGFYKQYKRFLKTIKRTRP
ncbi:MULTISPECIES: phage tail tape measure protein [Muribaculaceae]|uniref:phage tail tape measure protein n=1 Tax=Muribaculaceae TaxID=2005473 RepID=UPI00259C6DE3|nr:MULTISPECIES: phage tail tape measure protein [Muribaculaceae]